MEKLKFKEKIFEEAKNENFSKALSRYFMKSVLDKSGQRLLFLGGCQILQWDRSSPLFSVFNPFLFPSLEKLNKQIYLKGQTKISEKYWKNDFIVKEFINKESEGKLG